MKVEALTKERLIDFVTYCKKHRSEVDDSFLYEHDLDNFEVNEDNPTVIATNEFGKITGVASLILNDYYRSGKQGRFRIFHSLINDFTCYHELLKTLLKLFDKSNMNELFIYIPTINEKLIKVVEGLNFIKERYAFLLLREDLPIPITSVPEEYYFKSFTLGKDEQTWCDIRNIAFAHLKGSQTPMTLEMAAKLPFKNDYIESGMRILYQNDKPVGVVRVSRDEYEGDPVANIGPVALIPDFQGKGLGRVLLREGLTIAKEKGFRRSVLSVNGENERAKALYLKVGFQEVESVVCYQYNLGK